MQREKKPDRRAEQMDPYPTEDDLKLRPMISGHGIRGTYHRSQRGIVVSMKKLKRCGVSLSKAERAADAPIVGELIIERVHDRELDFQATAEIVIFGQYNFPERQATLCNPVVFAADERGMVLHGIEKALLEGGGFASYQQVWLLLFGLPPSEPPP